METRAGYIAVGGFMLALLAGAIAAVLWLGRYQSTEDFAYYDILFASDVTGLQAGGTVRYRGVPVGRVTDIRIDPDSFERVRVTIEVRRGTPIHRTSVASLEFQGITGVLYVLIAGGTPDAARLPETRDPPYPVIAAMPGKFEGLFQGAPDLIANVNFLIGRVNALFSAENSAAIAGVLANLSALTAALSEDTGGVRALLQDGAAAVREIGAMSQQFTLLAEELNHSVSAAGGELEGSVAEMRALAAAFTKLAEQAELLLRESRGPLRDFTASGLYEGTQLIADLRILVASLSRISDQFERDPARFLFGDRRQGFEAE